MRSKRQLTEEILKTIPEESRPTIEMASKKWWVNLRDAGGLRLTDLGYEGDIIDKMFKSARYYFRKKSTEKNEPQARRTYIGTQKELLDAMDEHIINNIKKNDYKPSTAFHEFCLENLKLLQDGV